jgi:hypothetical protein
MVLLLMHGVACVQKSPLWHVLLDKHLAHFVGIIQHHVVQPNDKLWQPIVQMAYPPQIIICLCSIPLVD